MWENRVWRVTYSDLAASTAGAKGATGPEALPKLTNRPKRRRQASEPSHVDRKSTRLNSSHLVISYAVFCLKKKNRCILDMVAVARWPLATRDHLARPSPLRDHVTTTYA